MSKLIYQLITINTKPQSIELCSEPNASTPVLVGWTPCMIDISDCLE